MTVHSVKRLSLRSRSNERRLSAKDTLDPIKRLMDQQKVPVNGSPGSEVKKICIQSPFGV